MPGFIDPLDRNNAPPELCFDPQDIYGSRRFAWLSYFGIWLLVPLFVRKENLFVRYHVNQGIVLLLFSLIAGIGFAVVTGLLNLIKQGMGDFFLLPLLMIYYIFYMCCVVLGVVRVIRGQAKPLPLIGGIQILKDPE